MEESRSAACSIITVIAGRVNAVTPDEQINECLEKVLLTAFGLIKERGWHIPMGFTLAQSGEFSYVLSDKSTADDDDPYDYDEASDAVRDRVQKMVGEQNMVIAGVATNELTRFSDSADKQTTVKITICHRAAPGVTIFYPYRVVKGRVEQDQPLEMDADEDFFAGK